MNAQDKHVCPSQKKIKNHGHVSDPAPSWSDTTLAKMIKWALEALAQHIQPCQTCFSQWSNVEWSPMILIDMAAVQHRLFVIPTPQCLPEWWM